MPRGQHEEMMPVRCAGCAYTEGTEANRDVLTTTTRELCEMGRIQFYCHANAVNDKLPDGKRLCHGYMEKMLTEAGDGYTPPRWKQILAWEGLRLMEEEEDRMKAGAHARDEAETIRLLLSRAKRRIDPEETLQGSAPRR